MTPTATGAQPSAKLTLTLAPNTWGPLRVALEQFFKAHPELGLKYSENVYRNFSRIHGPKLLALGVLRKPSLRAAYIADFSNFDAPAFELLSSCGYSEDLAAGRVLEGQL